MTTRIKMRAPVCVLFLLLLFPTLTRSQGVSLGGGVETRTDVELYADLALDIRDIREFLAINDTIAASTLYYDGRNALLRPNVKLSIRDLSKLLALKDLSEATPPYIYHLWGLASRDLKAMPDQSLYAHTFVASAISSTPKIAADAMVALNLWMYAAHLLFRGVDICQKLSVADNSKAFDLGGGGVEEFIAIWIGQDQTAASNDGHGLYAMAQKAGSLFGKNSPEAQVNTNLKLLYQEGAEALSFPDACSKTNTYTFVQLWTIAQRIMSQMFIPLMQLLIDAVLRDDVNGVKLYATAIVPQISQCRPSLFKRLKESLLDNTLVSSKRLNILQDLQASYDCLGFTCSDIGFYKVDQLAECTDLPYTLPMAEYTPTSFVHDRAKIDLDVLQLQILTKVQAYSFAKALYQHGRNSPLPRDAENDPYALRSLQDFATSGERSAAEPFYNDFVSYHNDPNYANAVLMETLTETGKWGKQSSEQKESIIVETASYQIIYMFALAEMADAIVDCKNKDANDNAGGAHAWDEVAAYLIGSLEGTEAGGSADDEDGQLLWNLANKRAFQFQTENMQGYSEINSKLEDLLFAGRGQLDAFDCDNLAKTVDRMQHLLLLPIIQSTLRFAIILNTDLNSPSTNVALAEGEAFAVAVLPIIAKYDKDAADIIEENMVFQEGVKPVVDGPQVVADAFYQALDEFGYSCSLVGTTEQVDACKLAGGFSKVKGHSSRAQRVVAGMALGIVGIIFNLL